MWITLTGQLILPVWQNYPLLIFPCQMLPLLPHMKISSMTKCWHLLVTFKVQHQMIMTIFYLDYSWLQWQIWMMKTSMFKISSRYVTQPSIISMSANRLAVLEENIISRITCHLLEALQANPKKSWEYFFGETHYSGNVKGNCCCIWFYGV